MQSRTLGMPVAMRSVLAVPLLLTLLLHGVVLLRLWPDPERFLEPPDSAEYVTLASNLLDGHGLSLDTAPPWTPDLRRTPVYPAVLASAFAVAGRSPRVGAFVNLAAWSLTLVLVAVTMRRWGPRAALWAGAWLACDLTSLVYHQLVLTETLFTLLLLGAVGLLARRPNDRHTPVLAGVLLGIATLCRPIAVLLAPALGAWFAWRVWRDRLAPRIALRDYVILNAASGVFVLAWMARNAAVAGVLTLSAVGGVNMYLHRAAHVEATLTGRDVDAVRAELEQRYEQETAGLSEDDRLRWLEEQGSAVVSAHPAAYVAVSVSGIGEMLSPDRLTTLRLLNLPAASSSGRLLMATAWLQLGLFYVAVAAGVRRAWHRPDSRALVVLVGVVVAYVAVIGGPEMYARFRVPLMPPLALLAGFAVGPGHRHDA